MKTILHRAPQAALQHPVHLHSPIQQSTTFLWCIFNTLSSSLVVHGRDVCVWMVVCKYPPWKRSSSLLKFTVLNIVYLAVSRDMWWWPDQPFWLWNYPKCRTFAFSWAVLASRYKYTATEEEWVGVSSPGSGSRLWVRALETSGLLWAAQWVPVPVLSWWLGGNLRRSSVALRQWMMGTRGASAKPP